ncbi:MAG: UvrD-helicase domain-containing protein [Planctomycetaceae bacterium]
MSHDAEQLTDQQRNAIETRSVSIALSAGAGCGKTFVLTRRFLAQLQPGAADRPAKGRRKRPERKAAKGTAAKSGNLLFDVEEIDSSSADSRASGADLLQGLVAITFTERAAREMRDRIRAACHARLRSCSDGEIVHWQEILRGLDTARISTIHAFCASFLRSHAVEAGIDPQFSVLEDSTGDVILRRAVSGTIEDLLSDQDSDAMHLVLHFGLEKTHDYIRRLVKSRFQCGTKDFSDSSPEEQADQWRECWKTKYLPLLLQELTESAVVRNTIDLLTSNEPSHAKMQQRRQTLLQQLPLLSTSADPLAACAQLVEAAKVQGGGGASAWSDESIYVAVKNCLVKLRDALRDTAEGIHFDEEDLLDAVTFGLMFFRVARVAMERYEEQKRAGGFLDFDDLLIRTHHLLRDHESVRNRAARGIDLLMVDEFQDTDPVQSEIIRYLCGGDLTSGKLFLVGDAKQSIYRFRNADPRVFASVRDSLPAAGRLPLSTNFRSQPAVLNFVNSLFARTFGASYEPLVPHAVQTTPTPAIEFLFASAAGDDEEDDSADSRRRHEADWIARRIAQLLNGEEQPVRTGKEERDELGPLRSARPGDVAILFRTLSHVAFYEEALRAQGIDYYLVGGRAFFAQQEVFDVVNLCSSLDDPDDEVSLAGVLRSPFFALRDDSLLAMAETAGTLRAALDGNAPPQLSEQQQEQFRFAARTLAELRDRKDRIPLAALLKLAIDRTGYDAALLNEFLGRRKIANLQKLLDMARQFDRAGFATMGEFVERLRDSVLEQADEELAATHPETSNVVRLMTVHQSKGLEFPIVFVADMDSARKDHNDGPVHHETLGPLIPLPKRRGESRSNVGLRMKRLDDGPEDELEKLRLLYVATTRAADVLILSAGLDASRKLHSPWMKLIAERFDIDTGLPAVDPYFGGLSIGAVPPEEIPEIRVHRAPPSVVRSRTSQRLLRPLKEFRETVDAADPLALPAILPPIEPKPGPQTIVSVTAIDQADYRLRPATGTRAIEEQFLDDLEEVDEDQVGRSLGTLVHKMLERIDPQRPVQLESLARHAAYQTFRRSEPELEPMAIARVEAFVASAAYREISRAKRLLREIEFLLRWPRSTAANPAVLVSGTIDCIAEMPDGRWLLLDYKTGRMPLSESGLVLDRYGLQLGIYAMAASDLTGRIPDVVEIIAVHESVKTFQLQVTPSFVASVTKRIDAAVGRLTHPVAGSPG